MIRTLVCEILHKNIMMYGLVGCDRKQSEDHTFAAGYQKPKHGIQHNIGLHSRYKLRDPFQPFDPHER